MGWCSKKSWQSDIGLTRGAGRQALAVDPLSRVYDVQMQLLS